MIGLAQAKGSHRTRPGPESICAIPGGKTAGPQTCFAGSSCYTGNESPRSTPVAQIKVPLSRVFCQK